MKKLNGLNTESMSISHTGGDYGNTDVPPPPDVGSDVTIIDGDGELRFSGLLQTVDDENTVTMIVTTTGSKSIPHTWILRINMNTALCLTALDVYSCIVISDVLGRDWF